jgi:hypothetical protein
MNLIQALFLVLLPKVVVALFLVLPVPVLVPMPVLVLVLLWVGHLLEPAPAHLPLLPPDHLFYEKYQMLFYEIILQTCYITY